MILEQKNGSEKRIFEIIDNGLKVTEKSNLGELHRIVPFELISNDFVKLKFNPVQWIVILVMIVLLIISGFFIKLFGMEGEGRFYRLLILFLLGGGVSILFYGKSQIVLACYEGAGIEFFKYLPSQSKLDAFFAELFRRRDEVLKEKYGFVSEFIPYDKQIENINLLHSLGIINLEESKDLKDQLNELIPEDDEMRFNLN